MSALFDQERISLIAQNLNRAQLNYSCTRVLEIAKDVFSSHGAQGFNTSSISLIDDGHLLHRYNCLNPSMCIKSVEKCTAYDTHASCKPTMLSFYG